jgi:hypothetical protein
MTRRLAHLRDMLVLIAGLAAAGWVGASWGRATAPEPPCICVIKQPGLQAPPPSFKS